ARSRPSKVNAGTASIARYPNEDIFSLDVECLAIGRTHEKGDRAPCSYALVDGSGCLLKRTLIQPPREVVSYLTPFTGLREGDITAQNALRTEPRARSSRTPRGATTKGNLGGPGTPGGRRMDAAPGGP
ncbi:Atp13a1, partial [Symbiodinium pilosum]